MKLFVGSPVVFIRLISGSCSDNFYYITYFNVFYVLIFLEAVFIRDFKIFDMVCDF